MLYYSTSLAIFQQRWQAFLKRWKTERTELNLVEEDIQEDEHLGCSLYDKGFLAWYEEQPTE
jgi:hypothetical protein